MDSETRYKSSGFFGGSPDASNGLLARAAQPAVGEEASAVTSAYTRWRRGQKKPKGKGGRQPGPDVSAGGVGHGADVGAAAWIDIGDVGGQGTSTSTSCTSGALGRGANRAGSGLGAIAGRGYASIVVSASTGAGIGTSPTSTANKANNGVADTMTSPPAAFAVVGVGSMQSAVNVHKTATYGVGSSSGVSSRGAGVGTSSRTLRAPLSAGTGVPGPRGGCTDRPGAAAAAVVAVVAAAAAAAAAAATAAASGSPAQPGWPLPSIGIPANGQGTGGEVPSLPSSSQKSGKQPTSARGGTYNSGVGQGNDEAPTGRKRTKSEAHRGSSSGGGGGNPSGSRTTPAGAFPAGNVSTGGSPCGATSNHVGGKEGGAGAGAGGATGRTPSSEAASPKEQRRDKGNVPQRKQLPWGGKDWGGHPLSEAVRDDLLREVTLWSVYQDGTLVGEDGNHFFCSACAESGDLTCCDECPRVFHEECLPAGTDSQLAALHQTTDDLWYCPVCTDAGRVNLIDGEAPSLAQECVGTRQPSVDEEKSFGKGGNAGLGGDQSRAAPSAGPKPPSKAWATLLEVAAEESARTRTKENRVWNLSRMQAAREGEAKKCSLCRNDARGGWLECGRRVGRRVGGHVTCFTCLRERQGTDTSDVTRGYQKWERCLACDPILPQPTRVSTRLKSAKRRKGAVE